jgi:hypothetical protein
MNSGRYLLAVSFSGFDPMQTFSKRRHILAALQARRAHMAISSALRRDANAENAM